MKKKTFMKDSSPPTGMWHTIPIRISSKLKWSPIVYEKENNGVLVIKPRTFTEVIVVHVVKSVARFFFFFCRVRVLENNVR